jgi:hypothetical protein
MAVLAQLGSSVECRRDQARSFAAGDLLQVGGNDANVGADLVERGIALAGPALLPLPPWGLLAPVVLPAQRREVPFTVNLGAR